MTNGNFVSRSENWPNRTRERGFGHVAALIWIGGAGTLLLAGALRSTPAPAQDPGVVRCTLVELVDASGEVVATLGTDEDGFPRLQLRRAGAHATLAISEDSAGLAAGCPGGVSYVGIAKGSAYANFRGQNLRNGIWAGVTPRGEAGFRAYGESLKVGAQLEVDEDGEPVLRLADDRGQTVWEPREGSGGRGR